MFVVMVCELFSNNIDDNFMQIPYVDVFFALDAVLQVKSHARLNGDL